MLLVPLNPKKGLNADTVAQFVMGDRIAKTFRLRCQKPHRDGSKKDRHVWEIPNTPFERKKFLPKDQTLRWCRKCGAVSTQADIERSA